MNYRASESAQINPVHCAMLCPYAHHSTNKERVVSDGTYWNTKNNYDGGLGVKPAHSSTYQHCIDDLKSRNDRSNNITHALQQQRSELELTRARLTTHLILWWGSWQKLHVAGHTFPDRSERVLVWVVGPALAQLRTRVDDVWHCANQWSNMFLATQLAKQISTCTQAHMPGGYWNGS